MPVERHVKERLVGAAVLMAAAIILIPEMLSGPDRSSTQEAARVTSETAVKTYTIDLGDPTSSYTQVVESAPPQEGATPARSSASTGGNVSEPNSPGEPQTSPERVDTSPASGSSPARSAAEPSGANAADRSPPPARSSTVEQQPRNTAAESAPRPLASTRAVPTNKGWAVQLGSFSNRESAERLVNEFQAERYDAFVMPVKSGATTLYRVRIGPMKDRVDADETLKRVKAKVAGAAVVAHP